MQAYAQHLSAWHENERAFVSALTEVQGLATKLGLIVDGPLVTIEDYPLVVHMEVRPSGDLLVLASMDVGLGRDGQMLVQMTPGASRIFSTFKPHSADFYRQEFRRLIDAGASQ